MEIIILTINIIIILYSLIDDLSVYEIDAFEIGSWMIITEGFIYR